MAAFKDAFIEAIHDKMKIRLAFFSKEDGTTITRVCAPMDFGPSRRAQQKNDRYHLWDYESDVGQHVLSLNPDQVRDMLVLEDHFDPAEFVTWSTTASPWFVKRDWGDYS